MNRSLLIFDKDIGFYHLDSSGSMNFQAATKTAAVLSKVLDGNFI